jgi:transposase
VLAIAGDQEAAIASVSLVELPHGIYRADTPQRKKARQTFIDELVANLPVYPFTNWGRLAPRRSSQPCLVGALVESHWDGIAAYCKRENKVLLGFVEGLNNKIRVLQRRAYGIRDEEYLRLKVLTCMLPEI